MSLALARKYRPATFDDLIGQEAVSQTLSQALDSDRLSHAYLFSGLRGSGKTSTARIFAKALLCEKGQSSHPCNQCIHCTMANENRHMDIIEMDAASNRGIDDIKELIEHTKYKPGSARYKIFIIDEVHMLTSQAFNALLKTLEEPPSFIKFILATTDPLKLPATILSRTQHFRFIKIPSRLVLQHLEHILNKEEIEYEKEALEIIARSGAGSLRDSLTLLDQAIVYSRNHVDVATVTGMLGIIEPNLLENLLENILHKREDEILDFVKLAANYETEMIIDEFTLFLKEILLSRSHTLPTMIIERFFRILADSKALLNLGGDEEFILLLTLFKMMEALEIKEIDTMIKALERELKGVKRPDIVISPAPAAVASGEVITISEEDIPAPASLRSKSPAPQSESPKGSSEGEASPGSTPSTLDEERVGGGSEIEDEASAKQVAEAQHRKKFDLLVKKIYDRDYDLGSCFERTTRYKSFGEGVLLWESEAKGADRKLLITHWAMINMFAKELFGLETRIRNIPAKAAVEEEIAQKREESSPPKEEARSRKEDETNRSGDPAAECDDTSGSMLESIEMKSSCIMPDAGESEAAREKDPSHILEEPMVKEILDLFDPKKVRVRRKA